MNIHSHVKGEEAMTNKQTILITGATAGIGRHAALYLAARGHRVIATGRKLEALRALKEQAGALDLDVVPLDVTDAISIARAVDAVDILTDGKGVDALVNNAGYGLAGALAEIGDAELRAQFDTNVFGLMAVTRAFLPKMRSRGAGRIINVSSIGGRVTFPMFGAYHASKYAVEALSDALRMELAPFGIQTVLVEPGPIKSDFADRSMREISRYRNAESPYAPVYARAEQVKEVTDRTAASPEATSRAIARALEKRRPAARYVVPFYNSFMLWTLGALPARWADFLMRQLIGLTSKRLTERPDLARLAA
jgi:short-subunit dehydrogenase